MPGSTPRILHSAANSTRKHAPPVAGDSSASRPPSRCDQRNASASPKPTPPVVASASRPRRKGRKMVRRSPTGMPGPRSSTSNKSRFPSRRTRSRIVGSAASHEMLRLIKEEESPRSSAARLSGSWSLPNLAALRQSGPVKLTKLVRGELDWIVMKCLEKDRSRRYDTATGLARDVERYLADEVVEARPPSAGYRLRKFIRRNKGRVVAAGVLSAMLFLVVGLVIYGAWWAERQSAERRHEKALIAARNNDRVDATLDRISAALKAGRLEEAETLLDQASQQIDEQTPVKLRERHEKIAKDWRTVRDLEDIFEERWMVSPSDTRMDNERAKRRYPALFQGYGLAMGREPAAQIVETVKRSLISEALSSGLTEWFFVKPDYQGLLAVVDLLDSDPTRTALRRAITRSESDRIAELSKKIVGSQLSPSYAIGLGFGLGRKEELRILKVAWKNHPNSFPLALTIAIKSTMFERDVIHWGRIAVALRPNNPLARYYYAVALSLGRDPKEADPANAIDEFYEAIRLAPRFARAHGRLAYELHYDRKTNGRKREAMIAARKAIDLDEQSILGHLVVCSQLVEDKNYVEAASQYRQLAKFNSIRGDDELNSAYEHGLLSGFKSYAIEPLVTGLTAAGRPFEAYRLANGKPLNLGMFQVGGVVGREYYLPARAAALAGTGQGLDAPPPAARPAIRKHALDWLNANLDIYKKEVVALPVLGASAVGIVDPVV